MARACGVVFVGGVLRQKVDVFVRRRLRGVGWALVVCVRRHIGATQVLLHGLWIGLVGNVYGSVGECGGWRVIFRSDHAVGV